MGDTRIEWATKSWNPVTGCSKVSPGCEHCYAERMAKRLAGRCGYPADEPFRVTWHEDKLNEPLGWQKPQRVFVCSMGDVFHEDVQPEWVRRILTTVQATPQHQYMMLTKRGQAMVTALRTYYSEYGRDFGIIPQNLWLGVTVENQAAAARVYELELAGTFQGRGDPIRTHLFVSCEPMLEDIMDLHLDDHVISWVIAGAETGQGRRRFDEAWGLELREQCLAMGVAFFFKKNGAGGDTLGGEVVREFPKGLAGF